MIFTKLLFAGLGYSLNTSELKSALESVVGVTSANEVPIRNSSNKIDGVSPALSCLTIKRLMVAAGLESVSEKFGVGSAPPSEVGFTHPFTVPAPGHNLIRLRQYLQHCMILQKLH